VIGVLALQGGFAAHVERLRALGAPARGVRRAEELYPLSGLIVPGGESTAQRKLCAPELRNAVRELADRGALLLGTCAGAILLAEDFALIDIAVERNGYGRQLQSFVAPVHAAEGGGRIEGVFIRAPRIRECGPGVRVLGRLNGAPVWVQQDRTIACTFHPELATQPDVHKHFLSLIQEAA